MRSILLASLVMFSVNGFAAQGIGSETADLVGEGQPGVHQEVAKKGLNLSLAAAQKVKDGARSGYDKGKAGWDMFRDNPFQATKKILFYIPKKIAENVEEQSLVVEYRDVDGQDDELTEIDSYRLLWNVQTSPLVKGDWVALEFTVKAENGEDIDLTYATATVYNHMTDLGVDVDVLSYIYSKNQELVEEFGSTEQVNLVTLSANDNDVLDGLEVFGKDLGDISPYGVDIALVAKWSVAAGIDADDFGLGEGEVELDMSACVGLKFSKYGWSVTPEYCRVDNNVFGIESDIMQVTLQKDGANWSVSAGNRDDVDGGEMNYIRGQWKFGSKSSGKIPSQPHKGN